MIVATRNSVWRRADSRVLVYSALFFICALLSALGAGDVGVLAFLPAAAVIEITSRFRRDATHGSDSQSHA